MSSLALVTEKCLHSLRAFPLSPSWLAGGGQSIGRVHSRDSGPHMITEIFHRPQCHAQHDKLKARKRKDCWHLSSQETTVCAGALLPWKWRHTRLLVGSRERMPYFAVLHLLNSFFIKIHELFLPFQFPPSLCSVGGAALWVEATSGVKPHEHYKYEI